MAINFNDNIKVSANKPIDFKFGPFESVTQANSLIPESQRYHGLIFGVYTFPLDLANSDIEYYYYWDDLTDASVKRLLLEQNQLDAISNSNNAAENNPFATIQDISVITGGGNQVLFGGVPQWSGTGLIFNTPYTGYIISGTYYEAGPGTLTLTASDPTNPRRDRFYLNSSGWGFITGTPAAVPVAPQVDSITQIDRGDVLIDAAATVPTVTDINVYKENIEWTTSSGGTGTFNPNSTVDPYSGTKCFRATGVASGSFMQFDNGSDIDFSTIDSIGLFVQITPAYKGNQGLVLYLLNSAGNPISLNVPLPIQKNNTGWQFVSISSNQISVLSNSLRRIRIEFLGPSSSSVGFAVDNFILESGVSPGAVTGANITASNGLEKVNNDIRLGKLASAGERYVNIKDWSSGSYESFLLTTDYDGWSVSSPTPTSHLFMDDNFIFLGNYQTNSFGATFGAETFAEGTVYISANTGAGINYKVSEFKISSVTGAEYSDQILSKGIFYSGDYESNFVARSLVTKQYVDGAISGASHNPVTIGTPANGLSINGSQVLSIGLASSGVTGALSGTDWNTFNGKIGGSIASGQVAFGTGAGVIGGDSGLVWDNVNKRLGVGVTPNYPLEISGGDFQMQNNSYFRLKNSSGVTFRAFGINSGNVFYLGGLDSGPTSHEIGASSTSNIIRFYTAGLERLRLNTSFFGVFTNDPTNPLDVNGTTRIRTINNLGTTASRFLVADATGVVHQRTGAQIKTDLAISPYDLAQVGATNGQVLTWSTDNNRYEPQTSLASSAVLYTSQSLTNSQKSQARINIGSTSQPAQVISALTDQNDLVLTSNHVVFTGSGTVNLNGIVAGLDGEEVTIYASTGCTVSINAENAGSLAANRFASGLTIPALSGVRIKYRTTTNRWFVENVGLNDGRYLRKDIADTKTGNLTCVNGVIIQGHLDVNGSSAAAPGTALNRIRNASAGSGITQFFGTNGGSSRQHFAFYGSGDVEYISFGNGWVSSNVPTAYFRNPILCNGIQMVDNSHIGINATTGTKIGTATTQKIGFWNATPIVQPVSGGVNATFVSNGGTTVTNTDTFDNYTIAQVVRALRNMGLLA